MTFIESPMEIRQKGFESKYNFVCNCDACALNYPTFKVLEKELPAQSIDLVESAFSQIEKNLSDNEPFLAIESCKHLFKCLEQIPYLHAAKQRTRILLGTCCRLAYSV